MPAGSRIIVMVVGLTNAHAVWPHAPEVHIQDILNTAALSPTAGSPAIKRALGFPHGTLDLPAQAAGARQAVRLIAQPYSSTERDTIRFR